MTGLVLILLAIGCLYLHRKRKFERTNEFGIEQFPHYFGKLKASIGDRVLFGGSVFFAIIGLMILAAEHQDGWGGWVLALVYGWLLIGYVPGQRKRNP